jgi:hypothetical protein
MDGVIKTTAAVAFAGGLASRIGPANAADTPTGAAIYPPSLTGIRGQDPATVEVAHAMRDGVQISGAEATGRHPRRCAHERDGLLHRRHTRSRRYGSPCPRYRKN